MPFNPEVVRMFGGLEPSGQAHKVVETAVELGINPSSHVNRAVEGARENGKRKVIVKRDGPLAELKQRISRSLFERRGR